MPKKEKPISDFLNAVGDFFGNISKAFKWLARGTRIFEK